MDIENKQFEVFGNLTVKKRAGTSEGTHGYDYEITLSILYLLYGLRNESDFWLTSNAEDFGAFDDIVFKYKDQKNKSRTVLVQVKYCNKPRLSKNITFEDLFIDGKDRKRQKRDFGLNRYFKSYSEIKQNTKCKNSDITLVIHTNVNVNLKKKYRKARQFRNIREVFGRVKV